MVVLERIAYIHKKVHEGYVVHVAVSSAAQHGRAKIKIIISGQDGCTSAITRATIGAVLGSIAELVKRNVAVDRGHKHSDGSTEVSIWVSLGEYLTPFSS